MDASAFRRNRVKLAVAATGSGVRRVRERCRVEEDCAAEGSCTIDVRADGGTAICDASGGDRTETGDGEGKRGGRGGRCEAVANGGAVTIGDIDP
jgi:hypothetical protein